MQILTNKNGTRLKLTATELKQLNAVIPILAAIAKHGPDEVHDLAESGAEAIERTIERLTLADPVNA
jgi:hypothetical protein